MIGTALVITSLAVGLAPDPFFLLAARTTQGLAAAVMIPQIIASFQHSLTEPHGWRRPALRRILRVGTVGGQVLAGLISAFA